MMSTGASLESQGSEDGAHRAPSSGRRRVTEVAEASLNTMQMLVAFDPDGSLGLCAEDRQRLSETIRERGWSFPGDAPMEPIPFDIGAERRRLEKEARQ
jgi:hypothetical protein